MFTQHIGCHCDAREALPGVSRTLWKRRLCTHRLMLLTWGIPQGWRPPQPKGQASVSSQIGKSAHILSSKCRNPDDSYVSGDFTISPPMVAGVSTLCQLQFVDSSPNSRTSSFLVLDRTESLKFWLTLLRKFTPFIIRPTRTLIKFDLKILGILLSFKPNFVNGCIQILLNLRTTLQQITDLCVWNIWEEYHLH